ncbi:MAG TPA: serine/threonine-protein kinase, partial [Mycobacteriales bacterium]
VDERLDRDVAVKLFRTDLDDDARQESEVRLLASMNHPGLVAVYDAELGDPSYVVMELVDGPSLDAAMKSGQQLDVRRIGAEVADALAYVHARDVVHRDVKPGNVLLARDGRVKLADFGIARLVDQAHLTRTGQVMGTAAYLAPEQVRGEGVTGAADVYSLGLVLLEIATGRREFTGNATESAVARLHREPVVPASLPADLRTLLLAMTASEAAHRPTAATVAARLRSDDPATVALAPLPPSATQVLPAYVEPVVVPARRSTWGWWLAGVVVLAAVIAVVVALALTGNKGATPTPPPTIATSPTTAETTPQTSSTSEAPTTTSTSPTESTSSSAPTSTASSPAPTSASTSAATSPTGSGSLLPSLGAKAPTPTS